MNEALPTILKLKSRKLIGYLFENGNSVKSYPIMLVYKKTELDRPFQVGFSVSKRNFKKAVDRNRIKRLMRESFRKNKYLFNKVNSSQFLYMFVFTGKKMPDFLTIEKALKKLATKMELSDKV